MSCQTITGIFEMSTIVQRLKEEHQIILQGLVAIENLAFRLDKGDEISFSESRTLIFALQLIVEKVHHEKEERLLFPALAAHPRLKEGGPRCTTFMGLRIEDDIVSHILGSEDIGSEAQMPFGPSSPLSIPLEEHRAGHVGLLRVQLALDAVERTGMGRNRVVTAIREYVHLMRRHIDKEDTCLFVLADELLTPEEQRVLFEKSCEIDRGSSADMLREMRSILAPARRTSNRSIA